MLNGLLFWVDIQRKTTAENIWKSQALSRFDNEEISAAKEELWKIVGEPLLGKSVKRQGPSKSKAELQDICYAMKKLSEGDVLPMFLGTSNMVVKTPVYNIDSDKCDNGMIANGLKVLALIPSSQFTVIFQNM